MKIEGSGSISQRHGSADPDPHQNVMDPQHWFLLCLLGRDDTLTVKFLSLSCNPMSVVGELPIKLARKCVQALGSSIIDEDAQDRTQVGHQ